MFFSVGATASPPSFPVHENTQIFSVYDYDTGEMLGTTQMFPYDPSSYEIPSPENVESELMYAPPPYGLGGEGWNILLGTTSFVTKVEVDFDDRRIYVHVSGDENVPGFFQLWISGERLISGVQKVEVELDNSPLENIVTIDYGLTLIVCCWYTHSLHTLTFNLIASPGWHGQPISPTFIAPVIAVLIGAVYWLRRLI